MKMRQPHTLPLSRQATDILLEAQTLTGRQRYVFSSLYPGTRPMSENTINAALRRMGYAGDEMTAHGFRAMASTLLNESGKWNPDAIERALAHKVGDGVRSAYHRGTHGPSASRWLSGGLITSMNFGAATSHPRRMVEPFREERCLAIGAKIALRDQCC